MNLSSKFIILFNLPKLFLALTYVQLHCNFSCYMLNFFKHNSLYLNQLENKNSISPVSYENLNIYGEALKTHGKIVMAMLDVLRSINIKTMATDLMSINLYLNNISGSLNFIAKNNNGNFDRNPLSILIGYRMIHEMMVERLNSYIRAKCIKLQVDEVFVRCPNYNTSGNFNMKSLKEVAKKLKNRLDSSNENSKRNIYDPWLQNSETYNILASALSSNTYLDFDPKKLLFYDLMTRQMNMGEKKNHLGVIEYEDAIDQLRFATYKVQCPDKNFLAISDVFRYMTYCFDSYQVFKFHLLITAASFQPLAKLIRNYLVFINNLLHDNCTKLQGKFLDELITIGKVIIFNLERFNKIHIFREKQATLVEKLFCEIKEIFELFNHNNEIKKHESLSRITKQIAGYLKRNKLEYSNEIMSQRPCTNNIPDDIFQYTVKVCNQVTAYITELEKYAIYFENAHNTLYSEYKKTSRKYNLCDDQNKEYVCNNNYYSQLYNMENETTVRAENSTMNIDNDEDDFEYDVHHLISDLYTDLIIDDAKHSDDLTEFEYHFNWPSHMKDYLLFL
ncbi:uncharacterized protein LOC126900035 isoform X2 [Daktulosphaira vitifoliae]|uniref:uncharacterized protein LOC126900035 isoform X2 n=1 Tax=Daktulosphaira vitifoliae TaxID=58002 RepID=UPI0021A9C0E6|nr:uncharacterized protein LOC126900035 isoform X2 [Daktulosphaira vitifoliae]